MNEQVESPLQTLSHEMIKITIDLGDGQNEVISVRNGEQDQHERLANEFCRKHNYDQRIEAALAEQIKMNIENVITQ